MAPSSDERLESLEEARKQIGGSSALGSERYAIPKSWYDTFKKSKATSGPKHATAGEKNLVWLPLSAVQLLEQWYGESYAPSSSGWLKGTVIFVNDAGEEEVESSPTFASVEIRVDEKEKTPLSKLENVSASEEIPQLVRKALDSVPYLSKIDEEDVRLWIRKSGEAEFHLCSSDEAKAAAASEPEEDLPEEFEEAAESGALKVAPTLRSVLGPSQPGQTLHLLLELRDSEGKFPRKDGKLISSVITPRKGKDAPQSDVFIEKSRPISQSFSVNSDPSAGQTCDVQRTSDDRWLEAKIVKVQGDQITVHYLSFPSEVDEVFPIKSPRIQPPHSRVSAWREQLRVGEEIDVHTYAFQLRRGGRLYKLFWEKSGKTAWVAGTVRKVERSLPEPRVNVGVRFRFGAAESTAWVPLNSEKIAKRYTHLPRPKADALGPQSSQGAPPSKGVVGLRNLGNTCYMNSILQCLSHCEPLREFFISGDYANDLNFKNPLGTGGELAKAFAEVLTEIWSGEYQVVAPKRFKQVLAQVNVQFQGYQQHDSQELLTMLTDSLHEDLNRIKNKPATGPVESGGRPDEVVAKESWDTFRKRNVSKIVDEMYGLMKSHLVCNVCRKEAIKFDPYSNVSVPVPSMVVAKIQVIFVNKQKQAIRCVASVPKRSTGRTLAEWLCAHFSVQDHEDLLIAEVYLNTAAFFFHRIAIAGGVPSTEGGGEGFERKNVKDIRDGTTILAWQLPSKEEVRARPKCPPTSQALFDTRWNAFFKEINMMIEASTSPADEAMVTKCKDLFLAKYTSELCGPYPVAQRRLAEGLARIRSMEAAQVIAREAIRLAESQVGFQCPIDADLAQEADDGQSSMTGSGEQTAGNSSDSGSTASKPIQSKKSAASPFRKFLPRIIGGNPSTKEEVINGSANGSSSQLIVPPNTNTPPMNGNGSTHSSPAQAAASSSSPQHSPVDSSARIAVEVRHHRPGRIRKYRVPMFFAALPNQTVDALRADIDAYIAKHVLDGFSPDTGDQNIIPSAAAGAAQLELTSNHPHYAVDSRKNQAQSIPLSSFYSIELDTSSGVKLPEGPIPLSESLLRRFPANGVILYVIWKEGPAAEHAYQSVNQSEDNPEAMGDSDLGLGRIQVDATCLQKEEKDGEAERFITLEQCMDVFRQREQLGEDDPWYCDQCKTHQCVFKKMDLWDAPRVLVIHLKRFLYERVGGVLGERVQREKITDLVKFPIEGFDIGQMLVGKNQNHTRTVYDLFAVSNHMGGLGGGHYTAYVKATDGVWWLMNDGVATKVEKQDEESQIVSSNAYVLFYIRRD